MSKTEYWIADPEGVKAKVVGADVRDYWVKVHGWTECSEPTGHEFQWVRHSEHGGYGVLNHEAALLHEELGWVASDPPPQPGSPVSQADEPPAPTKSAAKAVSGDKKE